MENMKKFISELTKVYMEMESLSEEEKDIKTRVKESGGNPAIVAAVAKSIVKNKVDELKEKSEATVALIDLSRE